MSFQEYQKEWVKNNPDKIKATQQRYRENHPDRIKESQKRYKDKERERCREKSRLYRNTIFGRANRLTHGAKKRAILSNIPFALTTAWVEERIKAGKCEVSGIEFVLSDGRHPFAPSLDRTDPTKGYTEDNVKVVVWCYNAAKGVATHEDVVTLAEALVNTYVH